MTARAAAALLLSPLLALPAAGEAPGGRALAPRGRWHFEAPGSPAVRWSVLFRRTDSGDETRLLVETPGGRWTLRSSQPAEGHEQVFIPGEKAEANRKRMIAEGSIELDADTYEKLQSLALPAEPAATGRQ